MTSLRRQCGGGGGGERFFFLKLFLSDILEEN